MGFPIACSISQALADEKPVTAAEIRARARALLSRPEDPDGYADFKNHRLGGPMREEDSPGNFILREDGDELEFAGYMRRVRRMGNGTWRGIR